MTNTLTIGALTYEIGYGSAGGEFGGSGAQVQCTSLVTGGLFSFFDNETKHTVKESLIVDAGFQTPKGLASCVFGTSNAQLTAASFPITVIVAADPNFNRVDANVAVTSIVCQ